MKFVPLIPIVLLAGCSCAYCADVSISSVEIRTDTTNPNLVQNGGFETLDENGMAKGWSWATPAHTSCAVNESTFVGGHRSLKIVNNSPLESPYTGLLSIANPVKIEPDKPYTLSAWIKSDDPGVSSIVGGAGWRYRITLMPTGGEWKHVSMTMLPDNADKDFNIFIQSESPTKGLWIDDIKLEQSEFATIDRIPMDMARSIRILPENQDLELLSEGDFSVSFLIYVPKPISGTIEADISTSKEHVKQHVDLKSGTTRIMVNGKSDEAGYQPRTITLRLLDGSNELASAQTGIRFYSRQYTKAHLQSLKQALPEVKVKMDQLKAKGQDVSYPMISYTVLENFTGYALEDTDKNEVKRAAMALSDMDSIKLKLDREVSEALAGKLTLPAVPRWTGDTRPTIKGSSFLAPTTTPGKPGRETRPVFFAGYGHFAQVINDISKFPNYGTNIIQIEIGPSSTLPSENEVNTKPAYNLLTTLDRAEKEEVALNLLLSVHYVPQWVKDKIKAVTGSSEYSLRDPVSRDMIKRHIGAIIPIIKDHPALHSICLANEPTYFGDKTVYAVNDWHAWLKNRHGDIATLNNRWGTDYKSFDEIKLPYADDKDDKKPMGRWLDCIRWNQEFLASWYQMIADDVHAIAPNLPVHMKIQTPTLTGYADIKGGNDPYLVGCVNDINGNDSVNWYDFGGGEFAQGWMVNSRGEDLQRSVKDAPVFDSENHIIGDREMRYFPPEPVRAALWQQAIHGQSATTIWVWERTFDRMSDFYGDIMHRPACAEAVGIVNCDLNRAANEVTALQQVPSQVYILHDTSAMIYDEVNYDACAKNTYMALGFLGLKIGFITERQLEAGMLPDGAVLFVPNASHLSDAAFSTLKKYTGRIVMVGDKDLLGYNEYGKQRRDKLAADVVPYLPGRTSAQDLWKLFQVNLGKWGAQPLIETSNNNGRPVWGVELKSVKTPDGIVINLCNYLNKPVSVRLLHIGQSVSAVDILNGEPVSGNFNLQPLEIRLLKTK